MTEGKEEVYVALDDDGQVVAMCTTDPEIARDALRDWLSEGVQVDRWDKDDAVEAFTVNGGGQ